MPSPIQRVLLIGGGHTQVEVLRRWALQPVPGVELILLAAELRTPYSGMIPGVIAGHYSVEAAHLDLVPLAAAARAVLLHDQAVGIDLQARCVHRKRGGAVPFDFLSVNVGSTPAMSSTPGAAEHALAVKPIRGLLAGIRQLEQDGPSRPGRLKILMVGSGAAGTEVLLALHHRWRDRTGIEWLLLGAESDPLVGFPAGIRRRFRRIFSDRGIQFQGGKRVVAVTQRGVTTEDGGSVDGDILLWAAGAEAPAWLREVGLALDQAGFIAVNQHLQSTSHPWVFAAGDCATQIHSPSPKAGVFAVRQGPVLFENLRRAVRHEPLVEFIPQRQFLSILATGERHAVACRGRWSIAGRWVWRWKDSIDRRWMQQYRLGQPVPPTGRRQIPR